ATLSSSLDAKNRSLWRGSRVLREWKGKVVVGIYWPKDWIGRRTRNHDGGRIFYQRAILSTHYHALPAFQLLVLATDLNRGSSGVYLMLLESLIDGKLGTTLFAGTRSCPRH